MSTSNKLHLSKLESQFIKRLSNTETKLKKTLQRILNKRVYQKSLNLAIQDSKYPIIGQIKAYIFWKIVLCSCWQGLHFQIHSRKKIFIKVNCTNTLLVCLISFFFFLFVSSIARLSQRTNQINSELLKNFWQMKVLFSIISCSKIDVINFIISLNAFLWMLSYL